ncbi:hypothetical protein H6G94_05855 [Nostoc punctiforme FACHB-252]|jgi:hypothetical protein|uniref:Uncharacterized protein n=1 Tax=Nostoc punctiforme FACHB-252 TaxID=1357509 RepID=A0ABR8H6W8_NOSPU|nr:hypothetical protein [Nostoc punctiforme FACHB-252]
MTTELTTNFQSHNQKVMSTTDYANAPQMSLVERAIAPLNLFSRLH